MGKNKKKKFPKKVPPKKGPDVVLGSDIKHRIERLAFGSSAGAVLMAARKESTYTRIILSYGTTSKPMLINARELSARELLKRAKLKMNVKGRINALRRNGVEVEDVMRLRDDDVVVLEWVEGNGGRQGRDGTAGGRVGGDGMGEEEIVRGGETGHGTGHGRIAGDGMGEAEIVRDGEAGHEVGHVRIAGYGEAGHVAGGVKEDNARDGEAEHVAGDVKEENARDGEAWHGLGHVRIAAGHGEAGHVADDVKDEEDGVYEDDVPDNEDLEELDEESDSSSSADADDGTEVPIEFIRRARAAVAEQHGERMQSDTRVYPEFVSPKTRSPLPIDERRLHLMQTINEKSVTVVRAPTGSGKSTRLPQFILESQPTRAFVIVTQPRRIAAMSVADRVADETSTQTGNLIGYSVRTESLTSPNTRVLFCTIGVLLRRISLDPALAKVTHVIVDEAHERDVLCDMLLLVLKNMLLGSRRDLKIIICSATLDANVFMEYFAPLGEGRAATVDVPGSAFPVESRFLEESIRFAAIPQHKTKSDGRQVDVALVSALCDKYNRLNLKTTFGKRKSILIFVSGKSEISRVSSRLRADLHGSCEVFPLHSSLSHEDQRRVFYSANSPTKIKIIVATNVAETSITIDDVGCVIDTGKVKHASYDADNRMSKLEEIFISKSAAMQRRGRAGRTSNGLAFHIYAETRLELEFAPPAMLDDDLEDAVVMLKTMGSYDALDFFSKTLAPPPQHHVSRALEDLVDCGALRGDLFLPTRLDATALTPLGFHLARLGTSARVGKLLLFGCLFECLDPVLTVASVLDGKNPFPFDSFQGGKPKVSFGQIRKIFGANDFLAFVEARRVFYSRLEIDAPKKQMLSASAMEVNERLRKDFLKDLKSSGFIGIAENDEQLTSRLSKRANDADVVQMCLAAGLFPMVGRTDGENRITSGPGSAPSFPCSFQSTVWEPKQHSWFAYHERTRLVPGGVSLRKACPVSPAALVLFGGGFTRLRKSNEKTPFVNIRLGPCWFLSMKRKDSFLIIKLRHRLDEVLLKRFEGKVLDGDDTQLIEVVLDLVRENA